MSDYPSGEIMLGHPPDSTNMTKRFCLSEAVGFILNKHTSPISPLLPLTHSVDHIAEVTLHQDVQQLRFRVLPTWVQILPDGPTEQEGILGNDG